MARKTPEKINVLCGRDQYRLFKLVEEGYTSSGLTDEEFAAKAQIVLKVPVTVGNVHGARQQLSIKSNLMVQREHARAQKKTTITGRIEILEQRLHELLIELGKPGLKE